MSAETAATEMKEPLELSDALPMREERLFLLLSIFIGILSGLLVVSFRMAIEWLSILLLGVAPAPGQKRLFLIPAAVGLVVAVLTRYVFPGVRGSGVNQTKAALYIHNGYISVRTVIGKFLLSALAIGSGQSLGPEDPSLQIGAGVASLIGRRVGLRGRGFVCSLRSAQLRVWLRHSMRRSPRFYSRLKRSSASGPRACSAPSCWLQSRASPSRAGSGAQSRCSGFRRSHCAIRASCLHSRCWESSAALRRCSSQSRWRICDRACAVNRSGLRLLQPSIAGLLVGCIGYFGLPEVMGAGYGAIDQAMHAQFALKMLLLLAFFKIVATTVSFSSGTPGGMFAPTLFIGAMLGAAVGSFEKIFFPHLTGSIGSYALVGMGVLFAAFLRVPLTSVFMVLEVSGNYSIILPVILANTIAYLISRSLQPVPIFELLTNQDGLYLPSMEEEREENELRLEDAIEPLKYPIVAGSDSIPQILSSTGKQALLESPYVLVRCSDGWYTARKDEMERLISETPDDPSAPEAQQSLEERLGKERTPVVFPDQPLAIALSYFQRWPVLPVSNRAVRGVLEGVVSLDGVLRRYQQS